MPRKTKTRKKKSRSKRGGQFMNKIERMPSKVVSLGKTGVSTGVGVAEDIGKVGISVGKTALKDVESVSKKMLTMKRGKQGKQGKKGKKGSYRKFLSKKLKEVKSAHPNWPQSKVFKEAVKGWKSSKLI